MNSSDDNELKYLHDELASAREKIARLEAELAEARRVGRTDLQQANDELALYNEELLSEIEEHKRTEQELISVSRRLNEIIDFLPDATMAIDAKGRVIAWNKSMERMTGVEAREMLGKGDYCYAVPFYGKPRPMIIDLVFMRRKNVESQYDYVSSMGSTLAAETTVENLNGKRVHIWGLASALHDSDGNLAGAIESVRDITQRREAKERLAENERRFRLITDSLPVLICELDPEGRYLRANNRYETLYRVSPKDCIGRHVRDVLGEAGWEIVEPYLKRAMAGEPIFCEYDMPLPDGRVLNLYAHYLPDKDESGRVTSIHIWSQDISDLKKVEEELRRARSRAEEANRAKSIFLASMSHEVRTPLSGVLGMLQLLKLTGLNDEQRHFVDTAVRTGSGLVRVINDILDFSKMEAGKMDIRESPFDPSRALNSIAKFFAPEARDKGVALALELASDPKSRLPAMVIADSDRFSQIVTNLVSNAVKYTSRGSVDIKASSERAGEKVLITVRVSDTGVGIPGEMLPHIFTPFTQVDGSYVQRRQGAGLGLGIVKILAEMMGGAVDVDSAKGRGSTFSVTIPCTVSTDSVATQLPLPETGGGRSAGSKPRRVLLVEDNRVNRYGVQVMLTKAGHEVVSAEDGRRALELLADQSFDLVLMDIQMPVMDGLEATRRIREGEAGEANIDLPVVALTAHAMKGDREGFIEAGMDEYLAKPVERKDLLNILANVDRLRARGR